MKLSIRKQLLTLFMPFLFGLWIVSAVISYCLVSSFAKESFDRDLINSADSVVARLRRQPDGSVSIDLPPAAQAILRRAESDKIYYRVLSQNGTKISGDSNLPEPLPAHELEKPHLRMSSVAGVEIALVEIETDVDGDNVIVQVAETTNVRKRFSKNMLLSIAGPQFLIIALGLAAVWYGVTKILTPLRLLQHQLGNRSPSDLSSLSDDGVPEEVSPLVNAINKLLGRLREELKAHQRFISNAAHQLRTPLAGLKTYSSIGTEMSDPKDMTHIIRELDQGIDRASRMVSQLLALARADGNEQANAIVKSQIDMNFVVSDVTAELIEQAVRKDLELVYESSPEPAIVCGEPTGLRHLVSNLVENAIAYTPKGGKVQVKVRSDKGVVLSVIDSGRGIPLDERDKVFERFYRVEGTRGGGSGLGLSIVKEVANAHSAQISIGDGLGNVGTSVTVQFSSNGN
jgi:two-component system sensor histidine kinase TctE